MVFSLTGCGELCPLVEGEGAGDCKRASVG